jgi:hypothetical protein
MREGKMSPFSMSMEQIARASLDEQKSQPGQPVTEPVSQPGQPNNEPAAAASGGCDTGIAGIFVLFVAALVAKRKGLKP